MSTLTNKFKNPVERSSRSFMSSFPCPFRLYIPLPSTSDRRTLLLSLLDKNFHCLSEKELTRLAEDTTGFSGADLKALCTDAALGPIRQLGTQALTVDPKDVPPISFKHFRKALRGTKPSVAQSDLSVYLEWNDIFGSKGITEGESLSFDSDDNDA